MRTLSRKTGTVIGAIVGILLIACSEGGSQEAEVLATIDGQPVSMADVEDMAGDQLGQLDHEYRIQRYQLIESALNQIVGSRLLELEAEARGMSFEELVAAETAGRLQVTEDEITSWYERNAASLSGRSLEELYPRIEEYLTSTKREQILSELAQRLRGEREVEVLLEPFRVEFDNSRAPALGPAGAPVTLTEFSDFECPFCGRFFPTHQRLMETYGNRLRVVFRQYPLNTHPNAFSAALASLCADEQGRFWEMHDLMFAEQDQLGVAALKEKASRLGLDRQRFDECLDSGQYAERVRSDVREGNRAGVSGTPALYVNGIPVPGGAAPYEALARLIDQELERAGAR